MEKFMSSQSLGEIVAIMPQASEVFKQYKLDFCCGGNRPLIEAIMEQNLDEEEVLSRLHETLNESKTQEVASKDFREMTQRELIEHIEKTHHRYLKKVLPELSELTTKIMKVHGLNHDALFKVHKLFHALKVDLDQHLLKEEEILFPLIKALDKSCDSDVLYNVQNVMKETEAEHEVAGDIIKELRKITEDYKVPADGCSTYALTFKKLEEMESDLFQHIHLENNILFMNLRNNIIT